MIETQYKNLVEVYHPDKGGSNSQFQELQSAKQFLDEEVKARTKDPSNVWGS